MNKILSLAVLPILASDCISIIPDSGTVTGYTLNNDSAKANIETGYNITVRINSFSNSTQELKVCARKYILPKPHFAQKIFCSIVKELR